MRLALALAVSALLFTAMPVAAQTAAQMPACAAGDSVVWVNSSSKVYHAQGDPYFGKTKHGQYMCRSAADSGGYHASKSGSKGSTSGSAGSTPAASPGATSKHHHHHGASASPSPGAAASPAASSHHHHHHGNAQASPAPQAT